MLTENTEALKPGASYITIDADEIAIEREIAYIRICNTLGMADAAPEQVVEKVRELETYWKQMHGRRGE